MRKKCATEPKASFSASQGVFPCWCHILCWVVALVPSPKRLLQIPLVSAHWAHTTSLSSSLPCTGDGSRLNSEKQCYLFSLLLKMKVPLWHNAPFFFLEDPALQNNKKEQINFIYRFALRFLSLKAHIQVFLWMIQDAKKLLISYYKSFSACF